VGVDNFLIQSNQYGFTSYLPSYVNESSGARETLATREQVWLSLRYNHTLAIVDRTPRARTSSCRTRAACAWCRETASARSTPQVAPST